MGLDRRAPTKRSKSTAKGAKTSKKDAAQGARGARKAKAAPKTKAAPKAKSSPKAKSAPKAKAAPKLAALRLERPRMPFGGVLSAVQDFERRQLQRILGRSANIAEMCKRGLPSDVEMIAGDGSELRAIEIVDVVDVKTGATRYQLVVVPFENAALFADRSEDIVLSVVQNTVEPSEDGGDTLGPDLVLAWREGLGRLSLKSDHFDPE
jgi:hypothetical protein